MLERIEQTAQGPSIIFSHSVEPYLPHIAVIASFSMQATIWMEQDTVRRLIQGVRMPSGYRPPKDFIRNVFDVNASLLPDTGEALTNFIEALLGLERENYQRVMRALTLVVTGLHRLAEDISLSYALMVAALSLIHI